MTKIAINGFGRIGRTLLRCADASDLNIVAINDIANPENLAYLLKYDTVYGVWQDVSVDGDTLKAGRRTIKMLTEKDPATLPWKEMGVDVVAECSGIFTDRDGASKHLQAGAKKVIISAPAKGGGADVTVCLGVNFDSYDPDSHHIISNASCTTNCVAVVAKVINDNFGIEQSFMTTAHAYTASQTLVDGPAKKWRRGRAAAHSIVPSSTGASEATALVIPELKGKMVGRALRVPVICGSIIDFVCHTSKPVSADSVKKAFTNASASEKMKGILSATEDQLVSSDIVGNSASAIVDLGSVSVVGEHDLQLLAWYDNEWGYCCRLRDVTQKVAEMIAAPVGL